MILGLSRSWSVAGFCASALLVMPLLALLLEALTPDDAVFGHLMATVLPSYIRNSVLLIFWVSIGALLLALPCAWLMARCEFALRRYLQWALLLPLAMPGYIVAYVYTDLLDYAGPVQRALRAVFGWNSPQDYVFPDIRTLGGAACMLALVLFPYIYLLARTAFVEQSLHLVQASRIMGCSPWQSFWRLSLPMARPALAVGVALVAMETAADFATVSYFAVPTLTTAVYDTWLGYGNLTAAAKLSAIILLVVFLLIGIERFERRKQQLFQKSTAHQPQDLYRLSPMQTLLALGFCGAVLCFAFVLPFGILLSYAVKYFAQSWDARFWQLSVNSLSLALLTSAICLGLALLFMFVRRISPRASDALPSRLASLGYALPGTVLAIGVLIPLTWLDFGLNHLADWLGFKGPGLFFTGSVVALIFAFCVRFVAIAIGSVESSYKRISPSLDRVSVTLGQRPRQLLTRVHLPLLAKGLFAGALLVFIESMKELPAALLLRPIGFENLATFAFQYVSDEKLEYGALAAIVIVLVGLVPLIYLNRSLEQQR